jgi:hypothetical protein
LVDAEAGASLSILKKNLLRLWLKERLRDMFQATYQQLQFFVLRTLLLILVNNERIVFPPRPGAHLELRITNC